MYIVQVASECAPVIKAGGLGDVVYGLSRELEMQGHCVELILPKYDCMRYDHIWGLHPAYLDLKVPWYGPTLPVLFTAVGCMGGCASLLSPTLKICSLAGAVTTVVTTTPCGLPSSAKPLWNFCYAAISAPMSSTATTGRPG
jgi:hypothetical protein